MTSNDDAQFRPGKRVEHLLIRLQPTDWSLLLVGELAGGTRRRSIITIARCIVSAALNQPRFESTRWLAGPEQDELVTAFRQ